MGLIGGATIAIMAIAPTFSEVAGGLKAIERNLNPPGFDLQSSLMAGSVIWSMENLIKKEPIEPYPEKKRSEDRSIAKLIDRVRAAEQERDSIKAQLLEMIGKHTQSEQRNARLEAEVRQLKESAAKSFANLGMTESEKVTEWANKYRAERARNDTTERRANRAYEEMERMRKELEMVKTQLEKERESLTRNEKSYKAMLKSNMELACQAADLNKVKMSLEEGLRGSKTEMMSFDRCLVEATAKTAEAEARAAQFENDLIEHRRKSEQEANLLRQAIRKVDQERKDALAETAAMREKQSKLQADHEEMRKINGFLATTEASKIHAELCMARKRIQYLEMKRVGPSDPRVDSALVKKRKSQ